MSKKSIILTTVSVMLMSFFCGLFCEITIQHELISTAISYKNYSDYIITILGKNMAVITVFFIVSMIRIAKPVVFLVTGYKFFSLGFSAAYILYNLPHPISMIICCILVECIYTIPVIITLISMVFSPISADKKNVASGCIFALSILTLFSFIQGLLIQLFALS